MKKYFATLLIVCAFVFVGAHSVKAEVSCTLDSNPAYCSCSDGTSGQTVWGPGGPSCITNIVVNNSGKNIISRVSIPISSATTKLPNPTDLKAPVLPSSTDTSTAVTGTRVSPKEVSAIPVTTEKQTPASIPQNAVGDNIPPQVMLSSLQDGATVSGKVDLSAIATDNTGVFQVSFYKDRQFLGYDLNAPYNLSWDTTTTDNGKYTIIAKVFDNAGNITNSTPITVNVNNQTQGKQLPPTSGTGMIANPNNNPAPINLTCISLSNNTSYNCHCKRTDDNGDVTEWNGNWNSNGSACLTEEKILHSTSSNYSGTLFTHTLNYGENSVEVSKLQDFLIAQGLLTGPSNGYFGNQTLKAVYDFQIKNGIIGGDGTKVGPKTQAIINKIINSK